MKQNDKNHCSMKNSNRTILACMTAICMVSALHEACAQNLTVATYNIRNENAGDAKAGNGWEARYPWICSLIEFEGIDIFGAQEVLDDQLNDMLEALPEYGYAGAGRDDGKKKGEYAPIFYLKDRFKVLDSGWFWLSETPPIQRLGRRPSENLYLGTFQGQGDRQETLVLQPAYGSHRRTGAGRRSRTRCREDKGMVR